MIWQVYNIRYFIPVKFSVVCTTLQTYSRPSSNLVFHISSPLRQMFDEEWFGIICSEDNGEEQGLGWCVRGVISAPSRAPCIAVGQSFAVALMSLGFRGGSGTCSGIVPALWIAAHIFNVVSIDVATLKGSFSNNQAKLSSWGLHKIHRTGIHWKQETAFNKFSLYP